MINHNRLIETFLELVQIDSPSGSEEAIGRHLQNRLQALGLETRIDEAGNLIGALNGSRSDAPTLLLSAHMDTAGADTGIKPVIRDGVIYSDGATILGADDKSGVAAILETLTALRENGLRSPPLEVVISVGEEQGLYGARQLDCSRLRASYGVVMDSGGPISDIVVTAPSQDSMVFTVHGRSAHAGAEPEKGINAIRVAAEAIAAMPLGRIDKETTSNVGMISGGAARNIVPAEARVVGEARSRNAKKLDQLTAAIVASFEKAAARHGATVDAQVTRVYNTYRIADNEPILQAASAVLHSRGYTARLRASGGGTDGNIYNAAGIPCIVLSTGMAEVHTTQEHIAIADMTASAEVLCDLVQKLAT